MAGENITFTFPRDHTKPVTVAVEGIKGGDCAKVTEGVERALGVVKDMQPTSEMYEAPIEGQVHLTQKG